MAEPVGCWTGWWLVLVTLPGQPEYVEFRSQPLYECEVAADEWRNDECEVKIVPEAA